MHFWGEKTEFSSKLLKCVEHTFLFQKVQDTISKLSIWNHLGQQGGIVCERDDFKKFGKNYDRIHEIYERIGMTLGF